MNRERVLVVIDMQNDFVSGALKADGGELIVEGMAQLIENFDGEVVFTRDTHYENYMETQEGANLPVPHCIIGTEGWQIDGRIQKAMREDMKIFNKETFGSVQLAQYLLNVEGLKEVVLAGICTDICVVSNALLIKANMPEIKISVIKDLCAGVTAQSHMNALEAMKMCQIQIL